MKPDAFVAHVGELRASAILRTDRAAAVEPAMSAAIRAGFRIVEFTLTTPDAFKWIDTFAQREAIVVGAGTVLTPDQVSAAVDSGARFIVSPVVDEAVIEQALSLGVTVMPGCHTPTEMMRAHRAGAQLQKLFPAPATLPSYVRSSLGPLPFLKLVPTNGVDEHNVAEVLRAGAWGVGFVAPLFDPAAMAEGRLLEAVSAASSD